MPLELHGEAAPRDILEQEWWLAAIQEPLAKFGKMPDDWPTTTLPAFDAVWCAFQQGNEAGLDYDLRLRRAFFAEERNVGRASVLIEIAEEAELDVDAFRNLFQTEEPRAAVLAEASEGREKYRVRGTPTIMLPDGTRLRAPIAAPEMHDRKVTGVRPLPCRGDECLDATRQLFDRAIEAG